MKTASKIAELGMMNILYQIKNPLTNIRLCLELLESNPIVHNQQTYYAIIKKSTAEIETSIKDICSSFHDLGISLHVETEKGHI